MKVCLCYGNQGVQTERDILADKPDIIVKNKKGSVCLLIDVAIPSGGNVIQRQAEKKLKYKSRKNTNSANVEHEML
jgi:hypothetical protein